MTTPTPQPIEIFRPGTFTSVEGVKVNVTLADLEGAVAAYDPDGEPAPLVKGHPKLDHPAFGWVNGLSVVNGKLVAHPGDVEPSFAEELRAKRYRRVSASWYRPDDKNNPRPGRWYLKHVGFLGAAAPAVRDLKPVHFSEEQLAGAVTIDLDPQELTMPPETEDTSVDFAEREAAITTREQELADREARIKAREDEIAAEADAARHQANVSFAEGLIAGGKLKPFGKEKLVGLLDVLSETGPVSFGEAGELPPLDVFKEMLTAAEQFVSFSEAAPPEDEKAKGAVSFAAPAGFSVDQEAMQLHTRAQEYQAAHPEVSYIDAVKAVA